MIEDPIGRQVAERRMKARLELAMIDAEITLLQAQREALVQFLATSEDVESMLGAESEAALARKIEARLMEAAAQATPTPTPIPPTPIKGRSRSATAVRPVRRSRAAARGAPTPKRRPVTPPAPPPAPESLDLRSLILGVLREAAPQPLPVAEITRLAKARAGRRDFEEAPGAVLDGLKKEGLVQRQGHRWRATPLESPAEH